ncbi:MAG TPA: hypothetical protein VEH30_14005 [Terriglobales bacterium]|nr:hypothetical protein [Terriglobales bacterium]
MKLVWLGALIVMLAIPSLAKEKGKNDDIGPVATLNFVVVKVYNGKPVRNAAVVIHIVNEKGKQEKGDLELKTDLDGKASYEGVPYGKLRIQVLATGFQTFGADYDINQPTVDISIKLKRPEAQFSVYDSQPKDNKDNPPKPQ